MSEVLFHIVFPSPLPLWSTPVLPLVCCLSSTLVFFLFFQHASSSDSIFLLFIQFGTLCTSQLLLHPPHSLSDFLSSSFTSSYTLLHYTILSYFIFSIAENYIVYFLMFVIYLSQLESKRLEVRTPISCRIPKISTLPGTEACVHNY